MSDMFGLRVDNKGFDSESIKIFIMLKELGVLSLFGFSYPNKRNVS
ncbi:hypothetical protein RT0525 [Rickettsia typhi str. Wilmington]|uniref:Uncharacterized protein n=1 Tax=Rickettsia typhi (strain ATCC VR-144 / Wilmington) TaxID=257363 RepID=Q68WJ8_RICTY|nr:hypothetical protein RT0525 [Rickettsia typhi str. Wilmington]